MDGGELSDRDNLPSRQQKYSNPAMAVLVGLRDMFKTKEVCGVLSPDDRLDDKTVFVDGSSSGLGFAIAVEVAKRGANVIMACRSGIPEKGEEVKRLSGNPNVWMVHVDLADTNSIEAMIDSLWNNDNPASPIAHRPSPIAHRPSPIPPPDILILNAGIVPSRSRKTPQGLEEMFMVNYFSKFYFIRLLMERGIIEDPGSGILDPGKNDSGIAYRASPIAHRLSPIAHRVSRIILVTSESHRNPEAIDWESFGIYKDYGIKKSMELYGYYKLLLVTFARELSRRLNPDVTEKGSSASKESKPTESNTLPVTSVFAMCPGPVNSNIAREAPKIFHPLLKLVFGLFFKSPAKAAVPVVYLAASKDVEGKPFDYLFLMSRQRIDEKAEDPANGQRLWQVSQKLFDQLQPQKNNN